MDFSGLSADTAHRFRAVAEALHSFAEDFPAEPRVLDVGGYPGTFARHFKASYPRWKVTTLDRPEDNLPDYVHGTGAKIDFADKSFDAVTSIDTLEHIPPAERAAFLSELCRVSKSVVIVAAPFHHPATADVERLLDGLHRKIFNIPHPWLHEHVEHGLPDIHKTLAMLPKGYAVEDLQASYDLQSWLVWQALSLYRKLEGEIDNAWLGFDKVFATAPTPEITSVPYRYLIVARRGGRALNLSGGFTPEPDAGQEAVELARLFCRMMEVLSGKVGGEVTAVLPTRLVDERLKEALKAAESEILRLKARLDPHPPVASAAPERESTGSFPQRILRRFGKQ